MVELNEYKLRKALYEQLTASSSLMTMVSGVFSYVPEGTNFPYITISDSTISEFANLSKNGVEYQCLINVFSREAGTTQNADIADKIYGILQNASLSISGKTIVSMKVAQSKFTLENDGVTYKAMMKINVILMDS